MCSFSLFFIFSGLYLLTGVVYSKLKQQWTTMNLFKNENLRSRGMYSQTMIAVSSRIYVTALAVAVVALALFNGMTEVTIPTSVEAPSLATFERLQVAYPSTLSCPCQNVAIQYSTVLSVSPVYHQVSQMLDS